METLVPSCIQPQDEELAGQFAYELARDPANAYPIALRLTFGDFNKAMEMANVWKNDPAFQQAVREAQMHMTKFDRLKTKEDFAYEVQEKMSGMSGKIWLETARFFAELRGFVKKDETPQTLIQNVMVVPAEKSVDEWEAEASARQRKLQDEAKIINGDSTN